MGPWGGVGDVGVMMSGIKTLMGKLKADGRVRKRDNVIVRSGTTATSSSSKKSIHIVLISMLLIFVLIRLTV